MSTPVIAHTLSATEARERMCSAVWIDDFIAWTNPALEDCCRVRRASPTTFCSPADSDALCQPCFADHEPAWSTTRKISDIRLPAGQFTDVCSA